MEKNDDTVKDNNSIMFSISEIIIIIVSAIFPIVYLIINYIQATKVYSNYHSKYVMIYQAGYEVQRKSSNLALIFFILYVLFIIILKDKKKKKHIIIMLIVLLLLNYLFRMMNSFA